MANQNGKMTNQSNKLVKALLVLVMCFILWQTINWLNMPRHPSVHMHSSHIYQSPQRRSNDLDTKDPIKNRSKPISCSNPFPPGDETRLIDLTTFQFTTLSLVCNDVHGSLIVLLLVHSAPKRYERRASIRSTWGTLSNNLRVAFLLGAVDAQTQKDLDAENRLHGDLVQGNFIDAYRNLTYKHAMAFKYSVYHCPQAKFVLKVDDDVHVNMPTLLAHLQVDYFDRDAHNLLMCNVLYNSPAVRTNFKWKVTFNDYQHNKYPPYCPGWIILYSMDLVLALYKEVQRTKFFWIDDVLMTGILAQNLGITHTPFTEYITSHNDLNRMIKTNNIDKLFFFGNCEVSMETNNLVWNVIVENLRRLKKTIVS